MNLGKRRPSAPSALVDKIQMVPVSKLTRAKRNVKAHPPEQVDRLAASIQAFGFLVPIVIRKGEVVAGEGRLQAAIRMGFQEVPVVQADHLTEPQARAFRIADNQLAAMTGFEMADLTAELLALKDTALDLSILGFQEDALQALMFPGGEGDQGAVPPRNIKALTLTFSFEREDSLHQAQAALGLGQDRRAPGHVLLDLIDRAEGA